MQIVSLDGLSLTKKCVSWKQFSHVSGQEAIELFFANKIFWLTGLLLF